MSTPRYLTDGFCSIGFPEITKFALFIICRVPEHDNLLPCSHTIGFSNAALMVLDMSSFAECPRLMSPAKVINFQPL